MLRNTSLILCLALAALTVGCSNAPAPPPPDTRAADVQAVKDVEAAWLKDTCRQGRRQVGQLLCGRWLRAIPRGRDTEWEGGH